ncbi:MAG: carbohydrate kinase [Deltaproteobacteria bacterium]|nr:carbohydrate kinase [Deltaproteobacteria bacterium]
MKPLSGRTFDVVCVGEALVDFLPDRRGQRVRDVERWTRCPGGSPANVSIGLARLSARAAYLGVVGEDEFGAFLTDALAAEGVDVSAVRRTRLARTGLVFITLDESGERSFTDYRKPSAELLLEPGDVRRFELSDTRAAHLVANSLLEPAAGEAGRELLASARAAGCLTSCDPNLRCSFWDEPRRLRELIDSLLPLTDVIKLAEDEVEFVTAEKNPARAARRLAERGVKLAVVTLGARGAMACRDGRILAAVAPRVEVVDQTGAGDGFDAGLLFWITRAMRSGRAFESLSDAEIVAAMTLACRVGANVVTRLGAVAGLPRLAEVETSSHRRGL